MASASSPTRRSEPLAIALCVLSGVALASPADRAALQAVRTTSRIHVDGVLDEAGWQQALVLPLRYEHTPGDNVSPPVATECLLLVGDKHLYVGFRAHEP